VEIDEYRRMAQVEHSHWWYDSTRRLLQQLLAAEVASGGRFLDVGAGEVASAAILAEAFLKEAAFVTIGTNDLTQFTLAMDRGHPRLSPRADALDPAVLHLIARTSAAARRYGIPAAVCGALAGDLAAVPLLLGLGVGELSVGAGQAPSVKARIREVSLDACRALAVRALEATTAAEVRALLSEAGGTS